MENSKNTAGRDEREGMNVKERREMKQNKMKEEERDMFEEQNKETWKQRRKGHPWMRNEEKYETEEERSIDEK